MAISASVNVTTAMIVRLASDESPTYSTLGRKRRIMISSSAMVPAGRDESIRWADRSGASVAPGLAAAHLAMRPAMRLVT